MTFVFGVNLKRDWRIFAYEYSISY